MTKNIFTRKYVAVMIAALAMLSLVVLPAYASTAGDSQVSITGGVLSGGLVGFGNFTPIALDGSNKTTTADWTIGDVVDATGTGAGWNVSLTLTLFKEWLTDAYVTDGKTLGSASVLVTTAPVVTQVDDSSSEIETVTVVADAVALDTTSPIKLLSSALDGGMGSYSVSNMGVTLSVPANVYAATYKTEATVALVTGP